MKYLARVLAAVLIIVGVTNLVYARFVLKNNDDGTVDWQNTVGDKDGSDILYAAGAVYLTVEIPDLSAASSRAVISPVTRMRVSRIDHALSQTITGGVNYTFYSLPNNLTEASITEQLTNGTSRLVIATGSDLGERDTFIPLNTTHAHLDKGGKLIIQQDGNGGNAAVGWITITLEPY